jgi:hypothetical protein
MIKDGLVDIGVNLRNDSEENVRELKILESNEKFLLKGIFPPKRDDVKIIMFIDDYILDTITELEQTNEELSNATQSNNGKNSENGKEAIRIISLVKEYSRLWDLKKDMESVLKIFEKYRKARDENRVVATSHMQNLLSLISKQRLNFIQKRNSELIEF